MPALEQNGPHVLCRIKAIPGARADQIVGLLGDRLKVRVSAPPEAGKANAAIAALIAKALHKRPAEVTLESGPTSAEKSFRIADATVADVAAALGLN